MQRPLDSLREGANEHDSDSIRVKAAYQEKLCQVELVLGGKLIDRMKNDDHRAL